jgi:DNA modification methylase
MNSRLILGSCFDALPTLPRRQFRTAFIDPPYNIGMDYGNGKKADRLPAADYIERMQRLISLCAELLTHDGSLWFLINERWADQVGTALSAILPRRNRIIWRETFGQYRVDRYASGHRHLFWHVMDAKQSPFFTEDIRIPSQRMHDGDKRSAGPRVPDDVWQLPRLVGNSGERLSEHPCQLPEALLERIILCSTQPGDCVLDPTAGTGTTLRVAQRLGRQFVGVEQQPTFAALIRKRLDQPIQPTLF